MKNLHTSKRILSKDQAVKIAYSYARTSTKKSADGSNSIEEQSNRIREYCSKNGIKLLKIYSDPAKSGIQLNRPSLMNLLRKVRKTPVDYVIVTDFDRIDRDVSQLLAIRKLFIKFGTKIVNVSGQEIDCDPYSKFFDEIIAAVSALYPKVMAARRLHQKYERENI